MTEPIIPPYTEPKHWLDKAPWFPVDAPLKGALPRSRAMYRAIVEQFEVKTAKRYQRTSDDTYCNIFAWDVTSAMGAEIPHWIDDAGNASKFGKPNHELRVDGIFDWLKKHGGSWRECTRGEASMAAELGCPTVVLDKDDHIAVVVPVSGAADIRVTQAGAHNLVDAPLGDAWRATDLPKLHFFTHP